MSYSHTKRRKTIARLKRSNPRNWLAKFHDICAIQRRKNEGAFIGTAQDLVNNQPPTA